MDGKVVEPGPVLHVLQRIGGLGQAGRIVPRLIEDLIDLVEDPADQHRAPVDVHAELCCHRLNRVEG